MENCFEVERILPFSFVATHDQLENLNLLSDCSNLSKSPLLDCPLSAFYLHVIQLSVERLIVILGPITERFGELDLGTRCLNEAMHSLAIVLGAVGFGG